MKLRLSLMIVGALLGLSALVPRSSACAPACEPNAFAAYAFGGAADDKLAAVEATRDGGYVLAGTSESFGTGDADIWVLKLDAAGTPLWQKTYGGARGDEAQAIRETRDGGLLLVGSTQSFGAGGRDVWVLRLAPSGEIVWQKTYGTKGGEEVPVASTLTEDDGCVVLFGHGGTFKIGMLQAVRLDQEGRTVWHQQYDVRAMGDVFLVEAGEGNYLVALNSTLFKLNGETGTILLNLSDGVVPWALAYQGRDSRITALARTEGGYLVGGNYEANCLRYNDNNQALCDETDERAFVSKLRENGSPVWTVNFVVPSSLAPTPDGGFLLAGVTAVKTNKNALSFAMTEKWRSVVAKFDRAGILTWQHVLLPAPFPKLKTPGVASRAYAVASRAPGGGYALAGTSNSQQSKNDLYLFGLGEGQTGGVCDIETGIKPLESVSIQTPRAAPTRLKLRPDPPRLTEQKSSAQARSTSGFRLSVCDWVRAAAAQSH